MQQSAESAGVPTQGLARPVKGFRSDFMETLLLSFLVFIIAVAAMSIGALVSNRKISGSCGGLSKIPGVRCSACANRCEIEPGADRDGCTGVSESHDAPRDGLAQE